MCGCNNNLSQLSFLGEQGISVVNITSEAGEGNDIVLTFHMSDGSTITDIVVPGGQNGANGANGSNALTKAYVLESHIGLAYGSIVTGTAAVIDTQVVPIGTLLTNGDLVEYKALLASFDYGLDANTYTFGLSINGVTVQNMQLGALNAFIEGEINRVSATQVAYEIRVTNPANSVANNTQNYFGFVTVPTLVSNTLTIGLYVNNQTGDTIYLKKFNTKIFLK